MIKNDQRLTMPLWAAVVGLGLSFSVLGVSAVKARQVQEATAAGEIKMVEASGAGEMKLDQKEEKAVDYYLPYPGILPDHPLYWLKMIRDRVQLWLVSKPLEKAEKMLVYADKRLGAGWALVEGNKPDLGITTLTKGEKYLEQAVSEANRLEDNELNRQFKEKLTKAVKKHKQVLELISQKAGDDKKELLQQMLDKELIWQGVEEQTEENLLIIEAEGEIETYKDLSGENAFELLEKAAVQNNLEIKTKEYDFGVLVESIKGYDNTNEKAWIYFVNGESAQVAADKYELKPGDRVEWKYIKPMF